MQSEIRMARAADHVSLRALGDAVRDFALVMLDADGNILSWNHTAEAITGWSAAEALGRHMDLLYPDEAVAQSTPGRELGLAELHGHFEDDAWRVRKDGTRFWAGIVLTPLRTPEGRIMGYASVTRDLTERHRQEQNLRISEARFRSLVEGVRDYAMFMLDAAGDVASWNAGAENILGFEANEVIGTSSSRFLQGDDDQQGHSRRELRIAANEGRFKEEGWRVRKGGKPFWASVVLTAIRDPHGILLGYSNITRDLTERRRHEAALRESEERFRVLVESVVDYAIITLDEDGLVLSWNRGAERINGYAADEIIGRHFSCLYPPEDVRANKPWRHMVAARERGRAVDESWRIRQDGTQYWANNLIAALPAIEGRRRIFYMVTQDFTRRRHAETLADTTQRMHEFIAMLAHELRNPLAPIRNAVALMARRGLDDPLHEAMRQTIDRQSRNLTRIVDELLDVNRIARGQLTLDRHPIDLRDVIASAVETSRPVIDAHGHRLHISIEDHPVECLGDSMRLSQMMVNMLTNAAKYTPDGGDIWLSVTRVGIHAELRVRDNGRGIERDSIDRVFDLFTQVDPSTGSALGGLGVGLALVRRIVELHGGRVHASSEGLGKGSEFIVRLPLMNKAPELARQEKAAAPGEFHALRVLVVGDNENFADSTMRIMQALGHEVRKAIDGPAAIATAHEFVPDVVMLDIGMPLMAGYEVARALRTHSPRYRLVAITGWGHDAARRQTREAGFDDHLVKPVSESALIELLARAAAARTSH